MGISNDLNNIQYAINSDKLERKKRQQEREKKERKKEALEQFKKEALSELKRAFYLEYQKRGINAYLYLLENEGDIIETITTLLQQYYNENIIDIVGFLDGLYLSELKKYNSNYNLKIKEIERIKKEEIQKKLYDEINSYFKNYLKSPKVYIVECAKELKRPETIEAICKELSKGNQADFENYLLNYNKVYNQVLLLYKQKIDDYNQEIKEKIQMAKIKGQQKRKNQIASTAFWVLLNKTIKSPKKRR